MLFRRNLAVKFTDPKAVVRWCDVDQYNWPLFVFLSIKKKSSIQGRYSQSMVAASMFPTAGRCTHFLNVFFMMIRIPIKAMH